MKRFLILAAVVALACGPAAAAEKTPKGGRTLVLLETSKGNIKVELYPEKAPISVENFLAYVKEGYYDGLVFHRVIKGFMIQGGGFTKEMRPKSAGRPAIKNEAGNGLKNDRGTLAMARTNVVDSATAQFFINHATNDFLNHRDKTPQGFGYAVFGKVVEGMEVVDKIADVPTGRRGMFSDVPAETITILSAKVVDK